MMKTYERPIVIEKPEPWDEETPDICEPTSKEFFIILGAMVGSALIMTLLVIGAIYLAYNY